MKRLPRRRAAALLALLACSWAQAEAPAPFLDTRVEEWKERAVEAAVGAERIEEARACPPGSLSLYAGSDQAASELALSVALDGQPAGAHRFAPQEAAALSGGGLYRLGCFRLEPGEHQIEVSFRWSEAGSADAGQEARYDGAVGAAPDMTALELGLERQLLSAPAVVVRPLRPVAETRRSFWSIPARLLQRGDENGYVPGSGGDPRLRHARYLAASGQRLEALARLQRVLDEHPPAADAAIAYARLAQDMGAYRMADAALGPLLEARADSDALTALQVQRAGLLLQRAAVPEAAAALSGVSQRGKQSKPWKDMMVRVLLAQRRYGEASDVALSSTAGADFEAYVGYYNLGVALVLDGRVDQGVTVLDRVGTVVSADPQLQALADQANLMLAEHFLRLGQGASALPVLTRIRGSGHYASRAILCLGWAWLLPGGDKQQRVELGDERTQGPPPESIGGLNRHGLDANLYQRYKVRPFTRTALPAGEAARLERALAAWAELMDRDPADPAVRESLVAIAAALDRLGAHQDAARFYQRALQALEDEQAQLLQAQQIAQAGSWTDSVLRRDDGSEPGGAWQLQDLPAPALSVQLGDALAAAPLQQSLHDLRDLLALERFFAGLEAHLAAQAGEGDAAPGAALRQELAAWQPQLRQDQDRLRAALRAMALDALDQGGRRNSQLLAQTRFTLARMFDGPELAAGGGEGSR